MNAEEAGRFGLDRVAAKLGFPADWRELCLDWTDSGRVPAPDARPFLAAGYVARAGRDVGLTDAMIAALTAFAGRVAGDADLLAFFRFCHHRMRNDAEFTSDWDDPWPRLDGHLGADSGMFNALLMLSTVPQMQENYRRLGIPEEVARDTVGDLKRWMETDVYFQRHGRWGITPWIVRWLARHWEGKIFHLKRLHFTPLPFGGRLRAWRRKRDRVVLAISDAGVRYCADGTLWGPCCGEGAGPWTSALEETARTVTGNPVMPTGHARREPLTLSLDEWDLVLSPGDTILGIHIPTGSPMTFEDCGESFRMALEFYPRHFPDVKSRGFATTSWLLDARLEAILAPDSNISRMMRELYLFPNGLSGNEQYFARVWGWDVKDIAGLPRKTSLQKAIGRFVDEGRHFHGGSCFLLNEDLDWGKQVYRRMMDRL